MLRGQTVNIFLSTVPHWHSYLAFGTVLDCSVQHSAPQRCAQQYPESPVLTCNTSFLLFCLLLAPSFASQQHDVIL